jgi:hypothetical protein
VAGPIETNVAPVTWSHVMSPLGCGQERVTPDSLSVR